MIQIVININKLGETSFTVEATSIPYTPVAELLILGALDKAKERILAGVCRPEAYAEAPPRSHGEEPDTTVEGPDE